MMCRVLGVSASGFYDWFERPQSKREQANTQLIVRIRGSFAASDGTYGSPRILRDLQAAGETCSVNRVARLMQAAGIKARQKRRRVPGQLVSAVHSVAPNLLERQFQASGPNQKWAADFTYVWTAEGWLFVAVVLDLYSRRVVGWSMQPTMTAQLVMDALLMAILRRGRPNAVLHHSDQGRNIPVRTFSVTGSAHNLQQDRPQQRLANIAMENFLSTLNTRLGRGISDSIELSPDVFDYIERPYKQIAGIHTPSSPPI